MLDFGRDICGDLAQVTGREWLVTNGIGGYATGTLAGTLSRQYHGLLVAALQPPLGRTVLLTKLDETVTYHGQTYPLFTNRWRGGSVEPEGYRHLERFRLEGAIPVWSFAVGDALLEKRVWMEQGHNITYIQYTLRRASAPLDLALKALVTHRDHHGGGRFADWHMDITTVAHGLKVVAFDDAAPFYVLSDSASVEPHNEWYRDYFLSVEDYRGLDPLADNLYAGMFRATLQPGARLTIVASLDPDVSLDGDAAYARRRAYEQAVVEMAFPSGSEAAPPGLKINPSPTPPLEREGLRPPPSLLGKGAGGLGSSTAPAWIRQLALAADQFVVRRALPHDPDGRTVIAGYHWFGDWGRDTMIALPGLTLAAGRPDVARKLLRTFAHFVDQGMLPNRFPDASDEPEYNTVDATLWYFEAIRAYHAATGDDDLLRELFPVLEDIIAWHRRGTRYQIHVDPDDGLLYAGEPGVQLTWMDAKVDDWVVTPRIGKPVEINALWYNALRSMADFAHRLGQPALTYEMLAEEARQGFSRFWNAEAGFCYDVIDGPDGDDLSLRPNQLFAVALAHSPLTPDQQRGVVDACARALLTSHGLRSVAADHPDFLGVYGGDRYKRDAAYHQGTTWAWLIGPFVSAHLKVHHDPALAYSFLAPLEHHLNVHCVGSISEIFDGNAPFTSRGCIAQAWSVAEILRVWRELDMPNGQEVGAMWDNKH